MLGGGIGKGKDGNMRLSRTCWSMGAGKLGQGRVSEWSVQEINHGTWILGLILSLPTLNMSLIHIVGSKFPGI